jgi:hypothetical protein
MQMFNYIEYYQKENIKVRITVMQIVFFFVFFFFTSARSHTASHAA